jgi:hypothetical protein
MGTRDDRGDRERRGRRDGDERRRAPLTHVGGEVTTHGDAKAAALLAQALEATATVDKDELTHGFHTFPARMHPGIARSLVASFSSSGETVVDPFMGSGTVIVESMLAECRAVGVDLNPLALRVAEIKTQLRREGGRERFRSVARGVAERSEERVRARVDARAKLPPGEAQHWSGHTLKELAGLMEEIQKIEDAQDRRALEMVFSSIVVKVSQQRSDTAERETEKRIRKGLPTEIFLRRAEELVERWETLSEAAPEKCPRPLFFEGDARRLPKILPDRVRADAIISSPPYGGTYDYIDHHARRYAWLGIDTHRFERNEVGARRRLSGHDGERRWDAEVDEVLGAMAAVRARKDGPIVLLVGDAQIGTKRIEADAQLARLAPKSRLELVASASQQRPDFLGGKPRREHLVLLV